MVSPQGTKTENPTENGKRTRIITLVTAILLGIGCIWFLLWLFYFRFHQWTDDAYVNGNMTNVTAVIAGTPVAFYADNTDFVQEGQLLVLLDRSDHEMVYERELNALAETVLQVRQLYDNVQTAQANADNMRVQFSKAQYDYNNRSHLVDSQAISNEEFIHSRDALNTAELQLKQAEYQLKVAQDAAGNTSILQHPLIEKQKIVVRQAYYNLFHCSIYAPITGYVAQRTVQVGQWVTPTTFLMAIIPTDYMWVDANYKETQLGSMRIGQPAKVKFDYYDGEEFDGKVLGIAMGSGSVFSIIPPQNATGNWIKIVQRLPVRIAVDPVKMKKFPLRLGISAEVDVNISNTDLPMLAEVSSNYPIVTTRAFHFDSSEVDMVMEKVITDAMLQERRQDTGDRIQ